MHILLYCILGIIIPFVGTCIGSMLVFVLKKQISENFHKITIGIAVGVMLAASIWSLIIPSIEMSIDNYKFEWIPSVIGLCLGTLFLIMVDFFSSKIVDKKINMLNFSVTLHNIPEGMAVGVCFAGALAESVGVSLISALALAIGIGIQNIPEGAIISLPLYARGSKKIKAFMTGVISGMVEPVSACITIFLVNVVVPILPYLLSFAAGAMIYVAIEELIPELHAYNKNYIGIVSVIVGFIIMLILDVSLG